jgi:hypothetical protein
MLPVCQAAWLPGCQAAQEAKASAATVALFSAAICWWKLGSRQHETKKKFFKIAFHVI